MTNSAQKRKQTEAKMKPKKADGGWHLQPPRHAHRHHERGISSNCFRLSLMFGPQQTQQRWVATWQNTCMNAIDMAGRTSCGLRKHCH
jgi:hypothetical protein